MGEVKHYLKMQLILEQKNYKGNKRMRSLKLFFLCVCLHRGGVGSIVGKKRHYERMVSVSFQWLLVDQSDVDPIFDMRIAWLLFLFLSPHR